MGRLRPTVLALAALLAASHARASAQVFDTTQMINDHVRMQNQIVTDILVRNSMTTANRRANDKAAPPRRANKGNTPPSAPGGINTTPVPAGAATFRPVADSIVPKELARAVFESAAERAKMERFFGELLAGYKERARRRGAPLNDVSRAASFLISESYFVYSDGRALTEPQFAALAAQMREMFGSDDKFLARPDREKQQMYESFAIQGSLLGVGYEATRAAGDAKTLAGLRQMAKRVLEDLFSSRADEIRFTDNGVEFR